MVKFFNKIINIGDGHTGDQADQQKQQPQQNKNTCE